MNSKIKILHLIKSLGRGGAEMLLPETLRKHNRAQYEFHYVYFLPWKNQMEAALQENGAIVECFSANNNIQLLFKVKRIVEYVVKNNIRIIHAHLPWAGIVARLAGKWAGIPVVYTEHNKLERYHFATRYLNLSTMNLSTVIVAVSRDVEDSVRAHKRDLKVPVRTILNGVNVDYFVRTSRGTDVKKMCGIPQHAPVIGTIAVFRFQKRLDLWLELALQIIRLHPEVHFLIVGDGPLKAGLLKKCKLLGMENTVHFAGLQRDVRPYLGAMDIYMMTSVFEGLPIALLEAMSMSLPVISTNAGGIKEVIRHEQDGLLCSVENPGNLVSFADRLLNSQAERRRLGTAARQRVEHNFSLETMVEQLESLYLDIYKRPV